MFNTSFSIHPDKENLSEEKKWTEIGSLLEYETSSDALYLTCANGHVALVFYEHEMMRIVMNPKGRCDLAHSLAIAVEPSILSYQLVDKDDCLVVTSQTFRVEINKETIALKIYTIDGRLLTEHGNGTMAYDDDGQVICRNKMTEEERFYGFGEKSSFLNKRGEKLTMWNSDVYAPHNPETDALYQSIPFLLSFKNNGAYGLFFDNPSKVVFDLKSDDQAYRFSAEVGPLNYYLFAGPTLKDVIKQYTALTGRTPLPPKWALGYHQSRYSYKNEQEVRELVATFKEKQIPLSAVHLDIHYMKDYRVFTFHKHRFPDPSQFISQLKEENISIVTIVDPGVKATVEDDVYCEGVENDYFCKKIEGDIFFGDVWPGKSAFPDFSQQRVREWWGEKHRFYVERRIAGIWNDMNEPAIFNESKTMDLDVIHENEGKRTTHRQSHNLYGLWMAKATYEGLKKLESEERPFVLTRAGYASIQRYAAVWTGDNRSFWEHLQMSVPMLLNLGLSGVAFAGADVGGFAHDCNGELLTRWTQAAAFMPFFRNHSAIESRRQEPWAFGEKYEKLIGEAIRQRYRWLPYLYTCFRETERTGIPVMRPLFLQYERDETAHTIFDQFVVGDSLIVAPMMQPEQTYRAVYLPEGDWVRVSTNEVYKGGKHELIEVKLNDIALFVRDGMIIPLAQHNELQFHIYLLKSLQATGMWYEDDGETFRYKEGEYIEWELKAHVVNGKLYIQMIPHNNQYRRRTEKIRFVVHSEAQYDDVSVFYHEKKLTIKKENSNQLLIDFQY